MGAALLALAALSSCGSPPIRPNSLDESRGRPSDRTESLGGAEDPDDRAQRPRDDAPRNARSDRGTGDRGTGDRGTGDRDTGRDRDQRGPAGRVRDQERPSDPRPRPPVNSDRPSSRPRTDGTAEDRSPPERASAEDRARARLLPYLRPLQRNEEEAEKAFRALWSIPKPLIPALIGEVHNRSPSALRELQVLVLDEKRFTAVDAEGQQVLAYRIPGMGDCPFDTIAAGPVPKGIRVKLSRSSGFTVGEVVRAALINRFRSKDQPPELGHSHLETWWRQYYRRVRSTLRD